MRIPVETKAFMSDGERVIQYGVGNLVIKTFKDTSTLLIRPVHNDAGKQAHCFEFNHVLRHIKPMDIEADLTVDSYMNIAVIRVKIKKVGDIELRYSVDHNMIHGDYINVDGSQTNHIISFSEGEDYYISLDDGSFKFDNVERKWVFTGKDIRLVNIVDEE